MRLLLRADASPSTGAGHLARTLALAESARALGHDVVLAGSVTRVVWLSDLLHEVELVTPPPWSDLAAWAAREGCDVLHVDDYSAPADLRERCAQAGVLLSSIEDGGWGRRPADVVVDPTLGASEHMRPQDGSPVILRGAAQTVVRAAVRRGRLRAADRRASSDSGDLRVLVVLGGTDSGDLLPSVIDALDRAQRQPGVPPLRVRAVTDRVDAPGTARALDLTLVRPGPHLVDNMVDADLVVSAAGTTTGELMCLGVPMAVLPVADNQLEGYGELVARGLAVGIGVPGATRLAPEAWRELAQVLCSAAMRATLAREVTQVIDGAGAARVVRALEQGLGHDLVRSAPILNARAAKPADRAALLAWRNDPLTRAASRDPGVVEAGRHDVWLAAILDATDRHLLLIDDEAAQSIGSVRWDASPDDCRTWEVSISLAPHHRGRGWGGTVLDIGERALLAAEPSARRLLASVHGDNAPSLRMFEQAGYRPRSSLDALGLISLVKVID